MPHGTHNTAQTAFRLPQGLLARLRETAERRGVSMTEIVARGTEAELDRMAQHEPETTSPESEER